MAKPTFPRVLTANRLRDGEVVYRDGAGGWSVTFADAAVFADPAAAEAALAAAEADVAARKVVAVYLFDVIEDGTGWRPRETREVIRARGPTVRSDLGKQAGNSAEHGPRAGAVA
ncbi:MAG: DUF2849 domain-containing protein [Alphaproteobacteria bacterium]|nr:DUF2849 domain-containing protein [Alphaproteobacteria bacterium]